MEGRDGKMKGRGGRGGGGGGMAWRRKVVTGALFSCASRGVRKRTREEKGAATPDMWRGKKWSDGFERIREKKTSASNSEI